MNCRKQLRIASPANTRRTARLSRPRPVHRHDRLDLRRAARRAFAATRKGRSRGSVDAGDRFALPHAARHAPAAEGAAQRAVLPAAHPAHRRARDGKTGRSRGRGNHAQCPGIFRPRHEHRPATAPERAAPAGPARARDRGPGGFKLFRSFKESSRTFLRTGREVQAETRRSRRLRDEELSPVLGTPVRLLARRPGRGADERQAPRQGVRIHRRELRGKGLFFRSGGISRPRRRATGALSRPGRRTSRGCSTPAAPRACPRARC